VNTVDAPANSTAVRILLAAAALLLAASLFLPLWETEMESPQYHGEDEIKVQVYPGHVAGSLQEVETLNQYIGVHLPLDAPELRALPWALGLFGVLTLVAAFLPWTALKKASIANLALMVIGGAAGAGMLQYRLYQLGHERTHSVMRGVPNFTPPILGSMHLANFHIETGLELGGWFFALAIALTAIAIYLSRREAVRLPSVPLLHRAAVPR
jgi:copper chaperone NosL